MCSCFYSCLISTAWTEEINGRRSPRAHLHNRHGPMVVWKVFTAEANFSVKLLWSPETNSNFLLDFVQNDITPVLEFCLKYIGALVLQGINGGHMLGLKEKSCHHVRWGSRQTPKQEFKNGLPESAIGHSQMLTFSLPVESYLLLNLFLFYFQSIL